MKKFKDFPLKDFLRVLSLKQPVPGGGSVAALSGALGAALLLMVTNYSLGKEHSKTVEAKLKKLLKELNAILNRFTVLIDLDAEAYMGVVKTRKACLSGRQASAGTRKKALKKAAQVPAEVCALSYKTVELTPFLVLHGNKNLISDVKVALELLLAAYNSGKINVEINQ